MPKSKNAHQNPSAARRKWDKGLKLGELDFELVNDGDDCAIYRPVERPGRRHALSSVAAGLEVVAFAEGGFRCEYRGREPLPRWDQLVICIEADKLADLCRNLLAHLAGRAADEWRDVCEAREALAVATSRCEETQGLNLLIRGE